MKKTHSVTVRFSSAIFEKVKHRKNMSRYIRRLVSEDIAKTIEEENV